MRKPKKRRKKKRKEWNEAINENNLTIVDTKKSRPGNDFPVEAVKFEKKLVEDNWEVEGQK